MGFFQRNFGTQQSWGKQAEKQARLRRETERDLRRKADKKADKIRAAKKAQIDRRKAEAKAKAAKKR